MSTYAGRYVTAALTTAGTLARGVAVSVLLTGTDTLATLYTDRVKTATAPNPVTTDSGTGQCSFWAIPGIYDLAGPGVTVTGIEVPPDTAEAPVAHADSHATGGADPVTPASIGALRVAANLSDLASATSGRANIGLGNVDNTSDAAKNTATVTLTNKTISGATNTLSAIPESAVTNLTSDLAAKVAGTTSATAPSSPAADTLWYDKANDTWRRWNGSAWVVNAPVRNWLTVDGKYIREGVNGPRYRTAGYNCYVMRVAGGTTAQTMNATQRDAFFAQLRPNSLVRAWGFAPVAATYTWNQVLAEMDAIVASAKKAGHRIIFGLTDYGGRANDAYGAKTSTWFTSHQWRNSVYGANSYQDWLTAVVTRYVNEPTVAAYDLCNEPQDLAGAYTTDLALFASETSGWIKAINPNVLVYMGVQYASAVGGNSQYQTIFTSLDFCSAHHYDAIGYYSSQSTPLVCARALGKPLIVDEYGFWGKFAYGTWNDSDKDTNGLPAMSWLAQATMAQAELQTAFDIPDIFGALAWSWMDTDASWYTGGGMYEPLNQGGMRTAIRTTPLVERGFASDSIASMEGWIDAIFSLRYPPGTQIGGPNSGATTPNLIYDRYGNNNFRQATQANAPSAAQGAVPNNWPSLQFSGTNSIPASTWHTGSNQAHSLYAVIVPTSFPSSGNFQYVIAPSTNTNGFSVRINTSGAVELYWYGSGGAIIGTSATTLTLSKLNLVEVRWDASGGGWRIRLNASATSANGTTTHTLASDVAAIGAAHDGTAGFVGHLLEALKFTASIASQDQNRVFGYFAQKYGVFG